jgi:hypothetical protein
MPDYSIVLSPGGYRTASSFTVGGVRLRVTERMARYRGLREWSGQAACTRRNQR